jgi:hypothetical protein
METAGPVDPIVVALELGKHRLYAVPDQLVARRERVPVDHRFRSQSRLGKGCSFFLEPTPPPSELPTHAAGSR